MARVSATRWIGLVLGVILSLFGAYILFEKVFLAISDGQSYERAGIVERTEEPFSFWLGVATYGVCASAVLLGGVAAIFAAARKPSGSP